MTKLPTFEEEESNHSELSVILEKQQTSKSLLINKSFTLKEQQKRNLLGIGQHGSVIIKALHKETKRHIALKIKNKKNLSREQIDAVREEI